MILYITVRKNPNVIGIVNRIGTNRLLLEREITSYTVDEIASSRLLISFELTNRKKEQYSGR